MFFYVYFKHHQHRVFGGAGGKLSFGLGLFEVVQQILIHTL